MSSPGHYVPQSAQFELLDPTSVVISICILAYLPLGTKLSIKNGMVKIDDVSALPFQQSFHRTMQGYSKEDLIQIQWPLKFFLAICHEHVTNIPHQAIIQQHLKLLLEQITNGLTRLLETYRQSYWLSLKPHSSILSQIESYIAFSKKTYDDADFESDEQEMKVYFASYLELTKKWTSLELEIILYDFNKLQEHTDNLSKPSTMSSLNSIVRIQSIIDETCSSLKSRIMAKQYEIM